MKRDVSCDRFKNLKRYRTSSIMLFYAFMGRFEVKIYSNLSVNISPPVDYNNKYLNK